MHRLVTDIVLPELNGIDLCRELKEMRPGIPVIMLTALGTTDDKVEGFDAGAPGCRPGNEPAIQNRETGQAGDFAIPSVRDKLR